MILTHPHAFAHSYSTQTKGLLRASFALNHEYHLHKINNPTHLLARLLLILLLGAMVLLRKKPTRLFADYDDVEREIRDEHRLVICLGERSGDARAGSVV